MKLTIIGCWGAYPKKGEASSCYLVSDGKKNVLLDIGSASLSVLQKYIDLSQIDAVFISHFHADHFSDIFCLQHAALVDTQLGKRKNPIKIYAPSDGFYFKKLDYHNYTKAFAITADSTINIGEMQFTFNETVHPIQGLSIRVSGGKKSLIYTSDTEYHQQLAEFSVGCDVLLGECSIYSHLADSIKGHMSGKDLAQLAKKSNAKKLIATHFPVYGNYQDLLVDLNDEVSIPILMAREGLVCDI